MTLVYFLVGHSRKTRRNGQVLSSIYKTGISKVYTISGPKGDVGEPGLKGEKGDSVCQNSSWLYLHILTFDFSTQGTPGDTGEPGLMGKMMFDGFFSYSVLIAVYYF